MNLLIWVWTHEQKYKKNDLPGEEIDEDWLTRKKDEDIDTSGEEREKKKKRWED